MNFHNVNPLANLLVSTCLTRKNPYSFTKYFICHQEYNSGSKIRVFSARSNFDHLYDLRLPGLRDPCCLAASSVTRTLYAGGSGIERRLYWTPARESAGSAESIRTDFHARSLSVSPGCRDLVVVPREDEGFVHLFKIIGSGNPKGRKSVLGEPSKKSRRVAVPTELVVFEAVQLSSRPSLVLACRRQRQQLDGDPDPTGAPATVETGTGGCLVEIDIETGSTLRTVTCFGSPDRLAVISVSAGRRLVIVVDSESGELYLIDTATWDVVRTFPLVDRLMGDRYPVGMTCYPNGGRLAFCFGAGTVETYRFNSRYWNEVIRRRR